MVLCARFTEPVKCDMKICVRRMCGQIELRVLALHEWKMDEENWSVSSKMLNLQAENGCVMVKQDICGSRWENLQRIVLEICAGRIVGLWGLVWFCFEQLFWNSKSKLPPTIDSKTGTVWSRFQVLLGVGRNGKQNLSNLVGCMAALWWGTGEPRNWEIKRKFG